MDNYVNLHNHGEFSLLDGAAKTKDIVELAANKGAKHIAFTDHGSMAGAIKQKKACEANGIQPIYGCELFLAEEFDKIHEDGFKFKNLHLTVLAKNQRGFEKLMKGLNYANKYGTAKSGKFKRSFLPIRYPLEHWVDDVVILSGCSSSPFYNITQSDGLKLFDEYANTFKEDFYGELMPLHDYEEQKRINKLAYENSIRNGNKYVVTNDIHYCYEQDWKLHELVICMSQKGMTWNNPHRWKFSTHLNYYRSADDMYNSLMTMGIGDEVAKNGIITTNEVAEKCSFKLQPYPLDLINPYPEDKDLGDEHSRFETYCWDGLESKGLISDVYKNRLEHEMGMIEHKNFVRYMLMVADVVGWAKKQGILIGPGRGSAAGSLVSFVLGITDVDPIKHNLLFERFISPDRINIPDIDIDVEDSKRELVEQYLKEKYGADNVAHVGTYSYMFGRSALRDVGRIHEVPLAEVDTAAKMLVKKPISDVREFNVIEDTLKQVDEFSKFAHKYPDVVVTAAKLEGQLKQTGIHAAGFVVSNGKLEESERCYLIDGNEGKKAVNWDKDDLEFFGYVKLDLLGLNTLSVIGETLKLIKEKKGILIDLNKLETYDEKTYGAISKGETATTFQINTPAFTSYCKQLQPTNFEDIAALTALWRPGPIGAGQAKNYVEIRHNRIKPSYPCDAYRKIVESTRSQLIYQEQITQILTDLAGFTFVEADKVRKIIAKSEGVQKLKDYLTKFVEGCKIKGTLDGDASSKLWESLYEFGRYGFNKCLTGDTIVYRAGRGGKGKNNQDFVSIKELYKIQNSKTPLGKKFRSGRCRILMMCDDGRVRPGFIKSVKLNDIQNVHKITTLSGKIIKATSDHRFLTNRGYKEVYELESGDEFVVMLPYEKQKYIKKGTQIRGSGENNLGWIDGRDVCFNNAKVEVLSRANNKCENCSVENKNNERYELAHQKSLLDLNGKYELYHNSNNIKLLCNSCHKKLDYNKKERKPAWSKGRPTKFDKIINIEYFGKEMTYDIEMNEPEHNFIANGIVSHNSHATAYGLMTYWTMYLKTHYPTEYLCAYLNYGSTDKENSDGETNLDSCLRECRRLGIEVLHPDINESNDGWTMVSDKKLRAGLQEIKYVGDNARIELMKTKSLCNDGIKIFNQFINSVERRVVNKRVIQALLYTGALDCLEGSETWKKNYDELYKTIGKKKFIEVFNMSSQLPMPEIKYEKLLNYSEKAITELEDIGKSIVGRMGGEYIGNDIPSIVFNDEFCSVHEAKRGLITGFKGGLIKPTKVLPAKEIQKTTKYCKLCDLRSGCTAPVPYEDGKLNVLIISEVPGYYEDQGGRPLIGKAAKLLWTELDKMGLNKSNFYTDNVVHCKPIERLTNNNYIDKCRIHLDTLLKELKPILVLALGNKSLYYFKKRESGIMALNGNTEWSLEYSCYITYSVSPGFAMMEDKPNQMEMFKQGLSEFKRMFDLLK